MSVGICVRCGKKGEVEYGVDGLPYCSSCIFYGLNKQCAICGMYLPAPEMQQYKGMWICPNCLADMRTKKKPEEEKKELTTSALMTSNVCERCGKEAEVFYIFNNKRLCASCYKEESEAMFSARKPFSAPIRVVPQKKPSLLEKIIDFILSLFGIKRKKEKEIVAIKPNELKGKEPLAEKSTGKKKIEAEVLKENKEDFKKFKKE